MNGFEAQQLELFSMILMRMSGFIFLNPLLRRSEVPAMAKAGLTFAMAFLLYPTALAPGAGGRKFSGVWGDPAW